MAAPMAVASLLTTVIGAGVSGYGAYEKGQATSSLMNYQARVAQINAANAQQQAGAEIVAGENRAQISGIQTAQRVGEMRAGIGAANLDAGSGSGSRVLASQQAVGGFEQAQIRNVAARQAFGSQTAAFQDTAQANVDIAAGTGAKQAAGFDVASSILGGATQVSDKWTKYGQTFGAPFMTS